MKRMLILLCTVLFLTACGSSEGVTITQTSGEGGVTTVIEEKSGKVTTVFEPRQEVSTDGETAAPDLDTAVEVDCEEAGITTRIPDYCSWNWSEKDQGLYIYVGLEERDTAIPYIYITRHRNTTETPEEYLADTTPYMEQSYGEKLVYSGDLEYRQYGPLNLASKTFRYRNDTGVVENVRLLQRYGADLVNYSVKYWEGDGEKTLEAFSMLIDSFRLTDVEAALPAPEETAQAKPAAAVEEEQGLTVRAAETKSLTWGKFSEPNGYFTLEAPSGWSVRIGQPDNDYIVDLISYAITVYDPACPERRLYFNLNTTGLLKSEEAKNWYARNYGSTSFFAKRPWLASGDTESFFAAMGPYFGYSGFRVEQYAGTTALGGKLLAASALSANGVKTAGLYTANLSDTLDYFAQVDSFNPAKGSVDIGYFTAYSVVMETAPVEDFANYQPVLDRILASIRFSQKFMDDRSEVWRQVIGTSRMIMTTADAVSAMIMDTWENSGRTYGILSQKQSDATLGYERVYDTETGEYLRAESGFGDWYQGSRYETVDTDRAYLEPYAGTIYWK